MKNVATSSVNKSPVKYTEEVNGMHFEASNRLTLFQQSKQNMQQPYVIARLEVLNSRLAKVVELLDSHNGSSENIKKSTKSLSAIVVYVSDFAQDFYKRLSQLTNAPEVDNTKKLLESIRSHVKAVKELNQSQQSLSQELGNSLKALDKFIELGFTRLHTPGFIKKY